MTKKRVQIDEGLAYLIEDAMERFEPVMMATGIADKMEKMLVDLAKILPDDIMPMQDAMSKHFGPEVASQFGQKTSEIINQAVTTMQSAKMAFDGEIQRLQKGAEGGDMSDMAMDAAAPPTAPPGPPGAPETASGGPSAEPVTPPAPDGSGPPDVGMPSPDMAGNAEDDMAGGFAGRPRKESAKPRGKKLDEFLATPDVMSTPSSPEHPYKSDLFHGNLDALKTFHGGLGRLAHNIEAMIDSGKLNGAERDGLSNVLSHMASVAHDAGHWMDPQTKLHSSLEQNHITNLHDPNVALIVKDLGKLATGLSLRHGSVMEKSVIALRKARDPDALVLKTFRTKLSEGRDAQLACIRTARQYSIDIEDVVAVVREAAAKNPFSHKPEKGKPFKPFVKGKAGKKWGKVAEDMPPTPGNATPQPQQTQQMQQPVQPAAAPQSGVPIFPVSQSTPAQANAIAPPTVTGAPMAANQSASTRRPMAPAEKTMAVQQQNQAQAQVPQQQQQVAQQQVRPQQGNPTMTPPSNPQPLKRKVTMAGRGNSPAPNLR